MRLNKYISSAGYTSRRKADDLIFSGKVRVNGQIVKDPSFRASDTDEVYVEGKLLSLESKVYYMLNKPYGYMSSVSDPNFDKFVVDLVPSDKRVYPVGRLDVDSKGLLILTNDGELTNKLTHPSFEIEKVYIVETRDPLTKRDIEMLESGVHIDQKGPVRGDVVTVDDCKYQISICEGRNRQVRRMIKAVNNKVLNLTRIRTGPIELGDLKSGSYRKLTKEELNSLKEL